jgi:hypothetical protein
MKYPIPIKSFYIVTNVFQVTNNMGEQNNARIKGARSMAIIDEHIHFLHDLASTFTSRQAQAKRYQAILQESVCPGVFKKTFEGAEFMRVKNWSILVTDAKSSNGTSGSASTVTYVLSKNDSLSPKSYNVTITYDPMQEWWKNIKCECNRTRQYGRPCYHASYCLVYPPITDINAFVRDATKFSYKLQCWYAPEFSVVNMIQQYSGIVKIPSFDDLKFYCIFPPRIMALAGN